MMTLVIKVVNGGLGDEVELGDGWDQWSFFRITLYSKPSCEIT